MISFKEFLKIVSSYRYWKATPRDARFLYDFIKNDTRYGELPRNLLVNVHIETIFQNYEVWSQKELEFEYGGEEGGFAELDVITIPDSDYAIWLDQAFYNLDFRPLTTIRKYICVYVFQHIKKHEGCKLEFLSNSLFGHEDFTRKIPKLCKPLSEFWDDNLETAVIDFVTREGEKILEILNLNQFNSKILTSYIGSFIRNTFDYALEWSVIEEYDWDKL